MSEDKLIPMYELRCKGCSGRSVMSGMVDPAGTKWMCPHHGLAGADDDAPFTESGLGEVGQEFEVMDFALARVDEDYHVEQSLRIDEQDPFETPGKIRPADYEAVIVDGQSIPDRAAERGVAHGTVWSNINELQEEIDV